VTEASEKRQVDGETNVGKV